MSTNSSAASDDLEKGAGVAVKEVTKEEEVAVVDPRKAMLVNRFMDAFNVVNALVYIGMSAYIGKLTNSLWEAFLTFLCLLPVAIGTTFALHDMRKRSVRLYATTKQSAGGSDSDLSTKLLASEK